MTPVTVVVLTYKSVEWLKFCLEGLYMARNYAPFRVLVVGCDANEEVVNSGRLDVDYRSEDPNEYYINRVYKAWNRGVQKALTKDVVLINSDMYVSDYWLDELLAMRDRYKGILPTSLLVESGRIQSAFPDYVRDFGMTPENFDRKGWRAHAKALRKPELIIAGGLFMPVLVNKNTFIPYPPGNVGGMSGDRYMFNKMRDMQGLAHVTCMGSIVYHVQEGEMRG